MDRDDTTNSLAQSTQSTQSTQYTQAGHEWTGIRMGLKQNERGTLDGYSVFHFSICSKCGAEGAVRKVSNRHSRVFCEKACACVCVAVCGLSEFHAS